MKRTILLFVTGVMLLGAGQMACSKGQDTENVSEFKESVFLGDSVAYGFEFNEVLPEENVLAGAGATAGFAYEDLDTLTERDPKKVYILLGQCDLLMPVDDPLSLFHDDYTALVKAIQTKLPDCEIYLQSITPVTSDAIKQEPRYGQIDRYNDVIKLLAEELSVSYIDLEPLVSEHSDLYAEDGVHFQKEFYPLWLNYLADRR